MPYSKKTKYCVIPVMGSGDVMTQEEEMKQMQRIDDMLYVANYGCKNAILEEGTYTITFDETTPDETDYRFSIQAVNDENSVLCGILDGYFFNFDEEHARVEDIMFLGHSYSIFVEIQEDSETNEFDFVLRREELTDDVSFDFYNSSTYQHQDMIKICDILDDGTIIQNFEDKVYLKNVLLHINTSRNPHGNTLVQNNINVLDSLYVKSNTIYGSVYTTAVTGGVVNSQPVPAIIDNMPQNPVFVTVYPTSAGAGEIYWTISDGLINLYNTGNAGIILNLRIDVQ